ncbi:hypothetical protein GT043_13900 [Streptomyces sp. SID2131]|nr:hypothetical protein [Streptomyces sp. SID2131]
MPEATEPALPQEVARQTVREVPRSGVHPPVGQLTPVKSEALKAYAKVCETTIVLLQPRAVAQERERVVQAVPRHGRSR